MSLTLAQAELIRSTEHKAQHIKGTVSPLVQHGDTLSYWDGARGSGTFVTPTKNWE